MIKIVFEKQVVLIRNFIFFLDYEFIEKKAFELCDEDGDTGLSWEECEVCEVIFENI